MIKENHEIVHGIQKYFLIGVLLLLIIVLMMFLSPFLADVLMATIIVTAVYPLHRLLSKKARFPASLSSFISLLLVAVILLIPFVLFIFFMAQQAADAYVSISGKLNAMVIQSHVDSIDKFLAILPFGDKIKAFLASTPISPTDILKTAGDVVGNISSFLLGNTTNILKHLSVFAIHAMVFLITMFYLLRDGDRLVQYLYSLIPLSAEYRKELFKKLNKISYGIIYGIFGAAILQGILVGIGLAIVGINNPAFWGAIAALFSPLPYVGTAVVWVPCIIILVVEGHLWLALFLAIWCMIIVGTADNLIKPFLIGSRTTLHPLAVLLTILGGAFAFGLKGLLFGPFVLTLTLAFLHIYKLEYKSVLGSSNMKECD